jgi:hypothetical protein
MKIERANISDLGEEKALMITQFNRKWRNWGKSYHKTAQYNSKQMREERNEIIFNYCKKLSHVKSNCSKLMKKAGRREQKWYQEWCSWYCNGYCSFCSWVRKKVDHEIWIGDNGALYHYCDDDEGLYEYKTISEEIMVGNGNVGKLWCGILQKKCWKASYHAWQCEVCPVIIDDFLASLKMASI